jgi:hypothetical protein
MISNLGNICNIFRNVETIDQYKSSSFSTVNIGTYPCRVSKKHLTAKQDSPATISDVQYYLYFNPGVNVKLGDIAQVDGIKYRCAEPYIARAGFSVHHIEVEVYIEEKEA